MKSSTLDIGDLHLPTNVVTTTDIVLGGKGMGKTNLGSVLVEELTKRNLRWSVLDPIGVWWGLRHSADGKSPGIECVILGGPHGDIPIEPTGGAIVADLVIDEGANTIIDFSRKANGQMWGVGEKIRFVTDYTYRIFQRQGELVDGHRREPLKILLDEAARYIPQFIPAGGIDLAKCVAAWEQLAEEGRNIGLGVTFLTLRSARLNKSVSELADVMYAFRTVGPNSLRAIMDWLGEHVDKAHVRELAVKVRELDVGQCLVVSPGWLKVEKIATIRRRETFDSSATPKPGERAKRITGKAAKPDLKKYQERMAATIEKVKADNPAELRKEIARLTSELSKGQHKDTSGTQRGQVSDTPMGVSQWLEYGKKYGYAEFFEKKIAKEWQQIVDGANRGVKKLQTALQNIGETSEIYKTVPIFGMPVNEQASAGVSPSRPAVESTPQRREPHYKGAESRHSSAALPADGSITGPEQRILNAFATIEANNIPFALPLMAAFARYSVKSSGFEKALSLCRSKHLIEDGRLTTDGWALIPEKPEMPSTAEIHNAIMRVLSGPEKRILGPLLLQPSGINKDELAEQAHYSPNSSGFEKAISMVRSKGLLEKQGDSYRASDFLFI